MVSQLIHLFLRLFNMQISNLPDNYIPENLISDAEWDYACVKYKTDKPTQEQLEEASQEMADEYDTWTKNQEY